jgi:hypothetical protein
VGLKKLTKNQRIKAVAAAVGVAVLGGAATASAFASWKGMSMVGLAVIIIGGGLIFGSGGGGGSGEALLAVVALGLSIMGGYHDDGCYC